MQYILWTVNTIDFLFSTLHTTPLITLSGKIYICVLHVLHALQRYIFLDTFYIELNKIPKPGFVR